MPPGSLVITTGPHFTLIPLAAYDPELYVDQSVRVTIHIDLGSRPPTLSWQSHSDVPE